MESKGLQELVKYIFKNERTKAEFANNPESVISRFELTELEHKAVIDIHTKTGLVTGDSSALIEMIKSASWSAPMPLMDNNIA